LATVSSQWWSCALRSLEIAELAAEEEVLTHVTERAFDLALGLGTIRAARLGQEAVMAREVEQRAIVDDVTSLDVVTDHRRLHAVVEDLLWHATECFEGGDVAAQDCRQILMQHEAAPHHSAVPEHQREQPDDANDAGLGSELGLELREVYPRLRGGRLWACCPGGVSKRSSKGGGTTGLISRSRSVTAV
jgi:hypothetical protein